MTVTDASGRVLLRRRATADEVADALRAADEAERGARAALTQIAEERGLFPALGEAAS